MQGMLEPFDAWERARARDLEPRIAEAESRESILTKRKRKAEDEAAKLRGEEAAEAENAALETARELAELEVLSPPQLIASDVTPEEAGRLCHDNDGRIALWSDEGEIFKVVAGRYSKNEAPNVETFLKGHAGADLRVNRVSREMVKVTKGAVTMVLVVQPEVLASLNNKDTLRGLGYFARYLYGMPRSLLGSRDVDPPPVEEAALEAYRKTMTDLLDVEIPKDDRGEIVPHKVRFSPQADALLKEFQRWVEPQLGTFGEMAALKEWGSKLAGAVVRVAGLLHAVEHAGGDRAPWEIEVSAKTLERAIEIGCCYLDHSRAVLASMGADPRLAGVRYLVGFLKHRGISEVSARDLFQKVKDRSQFETMDKLEPVLDLLEEYGYVRKRAQPGGEKGGRPKSPMLEINPLSPAQNPRNPLNPHPNPARAFFEWLEGRRRPGDAEELPPPPDPSSEPVPNESAPEESARTDLAETQDSHQSDTGEEPYRKSGNEDVAAEQAPPETVYEETPGAYELVTESARLSEVAGFLQEVHHAALDIETTDLSPFEARVWLLALHAEGKTFLIDCFEVDPSPALEALEDKLLYVHNAEFDLPYLHHAYGFTPTETPIDTLHLSQTVRAGEWERKGNGGWQRIEHSLEAVLKRELGVKLGDKKKYQKGEAWKGDLTEEHLEYATGDVIHLKPLAEKLFILLEEHHLEETWELEQRAKPLFLEMCRRGIPFDRERWDGLADELENKVYELKERADFLAPPHPDGKEWNLNGPKALQAFKLAELDVPDLKRETLSRYDHPLVKAVSEYREARSGLSRARKWYEGRYKAGRVHPHWHPYGAVTGRVACKDPNVQSLTKEGGYRGCVRPEEGRVLVKADINQMELRVLAAVTEDETIIEVFRGGGDVNITTAEAITGRKVEKSDSERELAKAVNFGLSFGMGAKSFQEYARQRYGVVMTLEEAKEAKRKLLDAYPGIGRWHRRESGEYDKGNFEARTLLGRRRVVEPGYDGKPKFTERLNAPVQGTAADILKLAIARLWEGREEHPNALPVLTVHDEIVIECDEAEAERVDAWLSSTLRSAIVDTLGYPELAGEEAVETTISKAWGEE